MKASNNPWKSFGGMVGEIVAYRCSHCGREFPKRSDMRNHSRHEHHNGKHPEWDIRCKCAMAGIR